MYSFCFKRFLFTLFCCLVAFETGQLFGQCQSVQFQIFGHLEAGLEDNQGVSNASFAMGPHDIFVNAQLSSMISFLSETVINPKPGNGGFTADIERALVQFNYSGNHSLILGKMHTPINYWNDRYQCHGRLFFPTVDRPTSFSMVIPLHMLGLRLQGQNLGELNFGYDMVVGNGLSANDRGDNDLKKALTGAVHIKPWEGSRIGVGYFRDVIVDNAWGGQRGPSNAHRDTSIYKGDVIAHVITASAWLENERWEVQSELSLSVNAFPDSLGAANSVSHLSYLYCGYKFDDETVYGVVDWVEVPIENLHLNPYQLSKFGLGWEHAFNPFVNIKTQVQYFTALRKELIVPKPDKWEFRIQVAYGF